MSKNNPKERRRSSRKEVLETFQVFLVVPSRGLRRLQIKDVSEHGVSFVGDPVDKFAVGETVESFFYLNPTLRIPIPLTIRRVTGEDEPLIGAELGESENPGIKAFMSFLKLLDDLTAFL